MVVAYLDIETSSTKANDGMVVAIGILTGEKPEVRFAGTLEEEKNALQWLKDRLENIKLVVTWYGSGFDIPFLLTRALVHDVDLTGLVEVQMLDLYEWSRANLLLSSYQQSSVARFLGVGMPTDFHGGDVPTLFKRVEGGDMESRRLIVEHCKEDLVILKRIHERVRGHVERSWQGSQRGGKAEK